VNYLPFGLYTMGGIKSFSLKPDLLILMIIIQFVGLLHQKGSSKVEY